MVTVIEECPSRSLMARGWAPWAIARAAAVWRSSWNRRPSRPALPMALHHTRRKFELRGGGPFGPGNASRSPHGPDAKVLPKTSAWAASHSDCPDTSPRFGGTEAHHATDLQQLGRRFWDS
jgi:hypothetical protein